jgi:hypothetical protein
MPQQSSAALARPDTGSAVEPALQLQDVIDREGYAVFSVDHFVALVWKQPPAMRGVEDCRMVFEIMESRRKSKFGYLAIVEPDAGSNMPSDVRAALSSMLKQHQRSIAASLIVFEGTGFGASIVRSVVSAINLATRIEFPAKVESNLFRGNVWLTQQMRITSQVSAGGLTSSVNLFRSRWNVSARSMMAAVSLR